MFSLRIALWILSALTLVFATDVDLERQQNVNYRLPNNTHPETYDISITTRIDLDDFAFTGRVTIGIVVDYPTSEIVVHARQLNISTVSLRQRGREVRIRPFTYDAVPEFLTIKSDENAFSVGDRLELVVTYNGTLRTDDSGFYRSAYTNTNGNKT